MAPEIQNQDDQFKLNGQAALIFYLEEILQKYKEQFKSDLDDNKIIAESDSFTFNPSDIAGREYFPYENFATIRNDNLFPEIKGQEKALRRGIDYSTPGSFSINSMETNPDIQKLFEAFPQSVVDEIRPQIKIYKTFIVDNTKEYDWEIPLTIISNINPINGLPFTEEEKKQKVKEGGVGITSFTFDYKGTNIADNDVNLEATLNLLVSRPTLLTEEINPFDGAYLGRWATPLVSSTAADQGAGGLFAKRFYYSDLLTNAPNSYERKKFSNLDYRIKALIKYKLGKNFDTEYENYKAKHPEKNMASLSNVKKMFDNFTKMLYLIPHNHEISIENNYFIKIKIDYIASINNLLNSDKADILSISTMRQRLKELEEEYDLKRKEVEDKKANAVNNNLGGDSEAAKEERLKKFEAEDPSFKELQTIKNQIVLAQAEMYSDVLRQLVFGERTLYGGIRSLYRILVPSTSLGMNVDTSGLINNFSRVVGGNDMTTSVTSTAITANIKNILSLERISTEFIKKQTAEMGGNILNLRGGLVAGVGVEPTVGQARPANEQERDASLAEAAKKAPIADRIYNSGAQYVTFVFLGDILDILLKCLKNIKPASSRPKIVLGDIKLSIPNTLASGARDVYVNLADIPISFDLFMKFWRGLIENKPSSITVHTFIQALVDRLLRPVLGPDYFGKTGEMSNNQIKIGTKHITTPYLINGQDFVSKKQKEFDGFYGIISQTSFAYRYLISKDSPISNGLGDYFLIYDATTTPGQIKNNKGRKSEDIKQGIFHLKLSTDSSVITKFNFSRIDVPGTKEAIATQEGQKTNLISLKQMYQVDIHTNPALTFYKPGDILFIDPYLYADSNNPNSKIELANRLGIVGYFMVITSKFSITADEPIPKSVIKCKQIAWVDDAGNIVSPTTQ